LTAESLNLGENGNGREIYQSGDGAEGRGNQRIADARFANRALTAAFRLLELSALTFMSGLSA
jgi:hypothetical protein